MQESDQKTLEKHCSSLFCLQSRGAQLNNAHVCNDHFDKHVSCGFVNVTLEII